MDKQEMVKQAEEGFRELLQGLAAVEEGVSKSPRYYTDRDGVCHQEKAGTYNGAMSRAMVSDMFSYYPVLRNEYPEFGERIAGLYQQFTKLNDRLLRMHDDKKAGREFLAWHPKKEKKLIRKLAEVQDAAKAAYGQKEGRFLQGFIACCDIWIERVRVMGAWAFVLQETERIEAVRRDVWLSDLGEAERSLAEHFCKLRKRCLSLFPLTETGSKERMFLISRMGLLTRLTEVLL